MGTSPCACAASTGRAGRSGARSALASTLESIDRLYRPGLSATGQDEAAEGALDDDAGLQLLQVEAADDGARLDRVLATRLPQYSRSHWQRQIEAARVRIDGRAVSARTQVRVGQTIAAETLPPEAERPFAAEPLDIAVVDEDAALIVVDKPAGLVVHPAAGNWHGTLMQGLMHRWPELTQLPRAGIVHRLDKDTSGLMVVARTTAAQFDLVAQLQARSMGRDYLALVAGAIPSIVDRPGARRAQGAAAADLEESSVDAPIGRDRRNRLRMAVCEDGKPALTHYAPLAAGRFRTRPCTLVHCRLATGRTHQIRVHMAARGHPLLGDVLYGGPRVDDIIGRQALHAFRLQLLHPLDRQPRVWTCPPPQDFMQALAHCGFDVAAAWARLAARVRAREALADGARGA